MITRCKGCGLPEERIIVKGKLHVNLEPVSGLCLICLAQRSALGTVAATTEPFDARKAAANDAD